MSKIKIFSLGGLDENGKNMYVMEIDKDIFIFDCGLKYASGNMLGIDYIIPDFSYLVKNRKRIKGLFITHGHLENMGATSDLLSQIPNIRVYATKFTKYVLMENGVNSNNIIEIQAHKKMNFGHVSIFPISVTHSAPDAVMYVVNTKDGAICYTGDFIFDPSMMGAYDMDLGKIAYIGKKGVLCLLSESVFSENVGHTSPNHKLIDVFRKAIKDAQGRIMFMVLPTHLYTIEEIFEASLNSHRKIVIMGKKLQNVVNFGLKEGYLSISNDMLGDLSNINDNNAILLICDDKASPYAAMSKILNGYDKFIKLRENDTVVFAEPRYDSNEKVLVRLENDLAEYGCEIVNIPKDKTILHHASSEDLMQMIKLMRPKYYMPVKGEYRYMVGNADLAYSLGIPKSSDDIGELVIKDREMLSENGIVLISATISKQDKILLVGPEVTTRGFIYVKDSAEMICEIKRISEAIIERNITPNYVDFNKIKTEIRDELSKYLFEETECKPMIIAVVQEV